MLTPAVKAVDGIWLDTVPTEANWNNGANWNTNPSFPDSSGDTATFDQNSGGITPAAYRVYVPDGVDILLQSLTFANGADGFQIRVASGGSLELQPALLGQGMFNLDATTIQHIFIEGSVAGSGGNFTFWNDTSAELGGGDVQYTASYATVAGGQGGIINFRNTSTASTSRISNQGSFFSGANGGSTLFRDSSTAGTAVIHNTGGNAVDASGGSTTFFNDSSAGSAEIFNHGGNDTNAEGGSLQFSNTSDSADAFIINYGAQVDDAAAGRTIFNSTDNVGTPTIYNMPGVVADAVGGYTRINQSQSTFSPIIFNVGSDPAASGGFGYTHVYGSSLLGDDTEIDNQGSTLASATGGETRFFDTSNAGGSQITNMAGSVTGAFGGFSIFNDSSTGGDAIIINHGASVSGAYGGNTFFYGNSTSAISIVNQGASISGAFAGYTNFNDSSTAANSIIVNEGGTGGNSLGGGTFFGANTTADTSTIYNYASTAANALGGGVILSDFSNAGSAYFVNYGGAAADTQGGSTIFQSNADGANAYILNTAATHADALSGGITEFRGASSAGSALVLNQAATIADALGGQTSFINDSTAGSASIANQGAASPGALGGRLSFQDAGSAGSAIIENFAGSSLEGAGLTSFIGYSSMTFPTASAATIYNRAGNTVGGRTEFLDFATAGSATIISEGSMNALHAGGDTTFNANSTAGNATLVAESGINGGTIRFAPGSTGGSSRIILSGSGQLYVGNVGGILEIGSLESSVGGGGEVYVHANELVVGNLNTNTEFSGGIHATGGLRKVGSGILNLTGINTYTGDTNIDAGTLLANGVLASPNIHVNAAGVLGGSGLVQGNVFNGGIVSPGNSVGTLTINGNYSQSGTLVIEIEGWNPGQYDVLAIGGSASLGGRLTLVAGPGLTYTRGDRAEILTAGGGVSGQFNDVDNLQTGTILEAQVIYESNLVAVEIVQGSFEDFADDIVNANPDLAPEVRDLLQRTGLILDGVAFDAREQALIAFLNSIPLGDLPELYFKIAPEELGVIHELGVSMADATAGFFKRRAGDIRHGLRVAGNLESTAMSADPKSSKGPKALAPEVASPEDLRWSTFTYGDATWLDIENSGATPGYDTLSGGFSAGVDYQVNDALTIGLILTYTGSDADLHADGDLEMNSYAASMYAVWQAQGWYLNTLIGGAYNDIEYDRGGLLGMASGNTHGGAFNAYLGGGYEIKQDGWRFGPTWSLHYTYVGYGGFDERGSLAPLEIQSNDTQSLRSALGAEVAYVIKAGRRLFVPQVYFAWQHEFGDRTQATDFRFASGAGSVVRVEGPEVGRDALLLGASLSVLWNDQFSTFIGYNTQLMRDNYESHNITAGLTWSF